MYFGLSDHVPDRLTDQIRLVELNLVVAVCRDDQLPYARQRDEIRFTLVQNVIGPPAAPQHDQWEIAQGVRRRKTQLPEGNELLTPGLGGDPRMRHVHPRSPQPLRPHFVALQLSLSMKGV